MPNTNDVNDKDFECPKCGNGMGYMSNLEGEWRTCGNLDCKNKVLRKKHIPEKDLSDYFDLDYANGWTDVNPLEYEKCNGLGHERERRSIGNCREEIYCEICKIKYKIDSSG